MEKILKLLASSKNAPMSADVYRITFGDLLIKQRQKVRKLRNRIVQTFEKIFWAERIMQTLSPSPYFIGSVKVLGKQASHLTRQVKKDSVSSLKSLIDLINQSNDIANSHIDRRILIDPRESWLLQYKDCLKVLVVDDILQGLSEQIIALIELPSENNEDDQEDYESDDESYDSDDETDDNMTQYNQ